MAKSNSIRSQYAKESAYIRRRLKDIAAKDPDSFIVRRYENEFPALRDFKLRPSDSVIEKGLEKMRELRKAGAFSTKQQKQFVGQAIYTLNARGYKFINKSNFKDLFEFLDEARAQGIASIYGYEKVLETINRARKQGLTDEEIKANIDYWAEHKDDKIRKRLTLRKDRKVQGSDSDTVSRKVRRK